MKSTHCSAAHVVLRDGQDLRRHLHSAWSKISRHSQVRLGDGPKRNSFTNGTALIFTPRFHQRELADVVAAKPSGPVTHALRWARLNDEDFERLLFNLISHTRGGPKPAMASKDASS